MLAMAKDEDYSTFMVRVKQAYQRMRVGVDVENDLTARRKIRDQFFRGCKIPDWVSRGLRGCENLREVVRYVTEDMAKKGPRDDQRGAAWRQAQRPPAPAHPLPQLLNILAPPPVQRPMVGVVQRFVFQSAPAGVYRAPANYADQGKRFCYQCRLIDDHWVQQCRYKKYCSMCRAETTHNDNEHHRVMGTQGAPGGTD